MVHEGIESLACSRGSIMQYDPGWLRTLGSSDEHDLFNPTVIPHKQARVRLTDFEDIVGVHGKVRNIIDVSSVAFASLVPLANLHRFTNAFARLVSPDTEMVRRL